MNNLCHSPSPSSHASCVSSFSKSFTIFLFEMHVSPFTTHGWAWRKIIGCTVVGKQGDQIGHHHLQYIFVSWELIFVIYVLQIHKPFWISRIIIISSLDVFYKLYFLTFNPFPPLSWPNKKLRVNTKTSYEVPKSMLLPYIQL